MSEEIDRWVEYMKEHPDSWKRVHSEFVNAQFEKARAVWERLASTPEGRKKIIAIYNIKNTKGYPKLLGTGPDL